MDGLIGTNYFISDGGYSFNQTGTAFIFGTSLNNYGDFDIDIPGNINGKLHLSPDNRYKLSFYARGSDIDIYSFVYSYNSKSTNAYQDNNNHYHFSYNWNYYEQEILYDPITPKPQDFIFRYQRSLPRVPWWAQVSGLSLVQIPNL